MPQQPLRHTEMIPEVDMSFRIPFMRIATWFTARRGQQRRWRAATTLAELGELTACWLERRLASQPGYERNCGPDDETRELVPVLAAANRAGYATISSQPAFAPLVGYDDAVWAQRAAVSGFAEPALAHRITTAAVAAGLVVIQHASVHDHGADDGLVVTTRAGEPYTWFGRHLSLDDLATIYAGCSSAAIDAVADAVQLTVVDPDWERNDLLWPLLAQVVDPTARAGKRAHL
jgi:hypothetical protein